MKKRKDVVVLWEKTLREGDGEEHR